MEEVEEEEGTEQFEVFGVHRLPLAPGTRSGYLGVRPTKSKKRPWQAWIHIKGDKRRCLGSFEKKREATSAPAHGGPPAGGRRRQSRPCGSTGIASLTSQRWMFVTAVRRRFDTSGGKRATRPGRDLRLRRRIEVLLTSPHGSRASLAQPANACRSTTK